jgi:hypothetical protein
MAALEVGLPANTETMQSLTFRRAGELASQIEQPRDAGHWQKLKDEQQKRLRDDILGGFPDSSKAKQTLHQKLEHNGHAVEHWTFEPEPGILVPAVLCIPRGAEESRKRPAVVVVDEEGKQAAFDRGLIDALANEGFIVLAIDYRGAGETARTVPSIEYGPGTPEYNLTNYSLFIGRPLAGARVVDIRCATDFLTNRQEVDAARVAIAGRGRGALSAVLAASFDERFACVVADELLTTWVFNEEFVGIDLAYMIPRILTVGDMPHLLAHVAPRPLLITNPADGRRREVSVDDASRQLRYATAVYDTLGESDTVHISRDNAEAIAQFLVDRLQP